MSKSKQIANNRSPLPIDDKIVGLRKQRVVTLTAILDLEAAGAVAKEPGPAVTNIDHLALQLLDGPAAAKATPIDRRDLNARLFQFNLDLAVIDRALMIANQRAIVDHGNRSRELVAQHRGDWHKLQTERAETLIGLLTVNRKIEDLKSSMRSGGQFPGIDLDEFTPRLFGVGRLHNVVGHWAFEFLKAAAKVGLISEKDFRDV
jgi:hypothetical protein